MYVVGAGPLPTVPHLSFDHKPHPVWPRPPYSGPGSNDGEEQQHWGTQPQSESEGHFCFEHSVRETKGRQLGVSMLTPWLMLP